jgi:transposase
MESQAYATDLSDAEWAIIEPSIPEQLLGGRPATGAAGDCECDLVCFENGLPLA